MNLVRRIVAEREGKPKLRNDFMDLMIELKELGPAGEAGLEMTEELIAAQALVFYAAGVETTAAAMAYTLHELAWSPREQERCAAAAGGAGGAGDAGRLRRALQEALRLHPPAGVLLRRCVADCAVPELGLVIERGTKVLVSVTGLHYDPKYFPDPEKFDPDRFSDERISSIRSGTYLPFGEGPRNCIGARVARAAAEAGLARVLRAARVRPAGARAPRPDPRAVILRSADGLWLHLEPRSP